MPHPPYLSVHGPGPWQRVHVDFAAPLSTWPWAMAESTCGLCRTSQSMALGHTAMANSTCGLCRTSQYMALGHGREYMWTLPHLSVHGPGSWQRVHVDFAAPLSPWPLSPWPWAIRPWQRVYDDFAEKNGKKFLVVADSHSKWLEVLILNSTTAGSTVTELRKLFAAFSLNRTTDPSSHRRSLKHS